MSFRLSHRRPRRAPRLATLALRALEDRCVPANLVVTSVADEGPGSLRDTLGIANSNGQVDTITFDPVVFASNPTISLVLDQLTISEPVSIIGPASHVTIDAGKTMRHFDIDVPGLTNQVVNLSNLTLINGLTAGDVGGSILNYENLTLDSVEISGCKSLNGGAITQYGSAITILNSTICNNNAFSGAGLYAGGVSTIVIRNSTISGNSANQYGGGIALVGMLNPALTVSNTTITANRANAGAGGGVYATANTPLSFESTIVAGNIAVGSTAADFSAPAVMANACVIGVADAGITTLTGAGNQNGTVAAPLDPHLGPLSNNGGGTRTHLPSANSPAVNKGSNSAGLPFDQRGLPRLAQGVADVGSVEGVTPTPAAIAITPSVGTIGGTVQTITVSYFDDDGIDVSTIGTGDLTVTGPNGFVTTPTLTAIDINSNGSPRVATYIFTPPGGSWDYKDNGAYAIRIEANSAFDTSSPTPLAVSAGVLVNLSVSLSKIYVVDLAIDEDDGNYAAGDLSLREAIKLANVLGPGAGSDTIIFDPAVFGSATTITLTKGQLTIADSITIVGPAAGLTIDANQASRHFVIDVPSKTGQFVSLAHLTLVNGKSSPGGSIYNANEKLALNDCKITGNTSNNGGGAIYISAATGSIAMTDCVVSNNVSTSTSTFRGGGGLLAYSGSTISVTRCIFTGNHSAGGGGAILFPNSGGSLTLVDSTLAGNTAAGTPFGGGGALYLWGQATSIRNCLISANSSNAGGGIFSYNGSSLGSLIVEDSTVTLNTAKYGGGGIFCNPALPSSIRHCLISGNVADSGGGIYSRAQVLTVENSTLTGNSAQMSGGGFFQFFNTSAVIRGCTISGNSATTGGGVNANGPVTMQSSTVSGNSATTGGGIAISSATLTIQSSTVAFNSATTSGGGISGSSGTVTSTSSLIANNSAAAAPDISGSVTAISSLIGNSSGFFFANGSANNITDVNPLLGPLANYGGPTPTHCLLPGSPALNAGAPSGTTTDQRGYPRYYLGTADIGAYEAQPPRVLSMVINNGAAQRSRVTSITINFDSQLSIPATAFKLQRQSDGQYVDVSPEYIVGGPTSGVELSFSGALTEFGSLKDGRYTLTILSAAATNFVGALDGNADGVPGDDYVLLGSPANGLFRLFGDADGNGTVDGVDFGAFRNAFNTNSVAFDFDGNGVVDGLDFGQFRMRFGVMI